MTSGHSVQPRQKPQFVALPEPVAERAVEGKASSLAVIAASRRSVSSSSRALRRSRLARAVADRLVAEADRRREQEAASRCAPAAAARAAATGACLVTAAASSASAAWCARRAGSAVPRGFASSAATIARWSARLGSGRSSRRSRAGPGRAEADGPIRLEQHPGVHAVREAQELRRRDDLEQQELGLRGLAGNDVEQAPRGRGEPGGAREDGVAHGRGDFVPCREHLGDEERVAAGAAMQLVSVEVA